VPGALAAGGGRTRAKADHQDARRAEQVAAPAWGSALPQVRISEVAKTPMRRAHGRRGLPEHGPGRRPRPSPASSRCLWDWWSPSPNLAGGQPESFHRCWRQCSDGIDGKEIGGLKELAYGQLSLWRAGNANVVQFFLATVGDGNNMACRGWVTVLWSHAQACLPPDQGKPRTQRKGHPRPGKSKPRMENPPPYAGGRATYPALRHKSSNRCPATRRGSSRRVWIRLNLLGCAPNGLCARPPGRSGRTPRPPWGAWRGKSGDT